MQPRTLTLIIVLLPLIVSNLVYLLSAYKGFIPWCIPYLEGCTTISKAARSGDSLYIFRATMNAYGVLLLLFWMYVKQWLQLLYGYTTFMAHFIFCLGIIGAIFLILYVDFLGTIGEMNRFMRHVGIFVFFICTPLAQLLLLIQHYKLLSSLQKSKINPKILHYQLFVIVLILFIAIVSLALDITHTKSYESENIVEWNIALLMQLYFLGIFFIWKDYKYYLKKDN